MEDQPLLPAGKHSSAGEYLPVQRPYGEGFGPEQIEEQPQTPCLLLEYWDILRRRKWALVTIAFLGVATALAITLPQTPIYQARASIEIQELNENFLNMRDVNPTESGRGAYPPEYELQTQVNILQSDALIRHVMTRLNLEERLSGRENARGFTGWLRGKGLPAPNAIASRDDVMRCIAAKLKVRAPVNTRLLEILFEDSDPKLAAEIVNALAAELMQQNLEARWQTAQATGEWLTRQIEETKIKLEKSEAQLQEYATASGLLFTSERDNAAEEKLRQLQQEVSRAQADRVVRQSRYEQVATVSADSLPEVLDNSTLKEYQVKLTDLRRQLAELSSSLTAAHPSVKKMQAQVRALESALQSERNNIVGRIRNEFESARRRENLLAADYASQAQVMSGQARKVTQYNILKREVDTLRQLYNSMLQRVKEAGLASALRAGNMRLVDQAEPPERPYKPRIGLSSALGLLTGLFCGVVFVVMRERANRTIQTPGDASLYLKLPELGVIPAAKVGDRDIAGYYGERLTAQVVRSNEESRHERVELATWQKRSSFLADSFRATLDSILYCGVNGNRPRVIALTSANPGEGKTTLATNLALALAEIGRRVLLVDGDLRNPRIHALFLLSNEWGFADVLEGKEIPPDRETIFLETQYRELCLLPAGSPPASVSDVLHSARASEFIRSMRREFDAVIIDTPPILHIPDARVLGRLSDGVILVVRAAETMRESAMAARSRLTQDGTRLLGTILNQWDPSRMTRYPYGYYQHRR